MKAVVLLMSKCRKTFVDSELKVIHGSLAKVKDIVRWYTIKIGIKFTEIIPRLSIVHSKGPLFRISIVSWMFEHDVYQNL